MATSLTGGNDMRGEIMDYTHIFYEAGNGWPADGADVLVEGDCGVCEIKKITSSTIIHTRQSGSNYIYLALEDGRHWENMTRAEQDDAWSNLYHVVEIDDIHPLDFDCY